MSDLHAWGDPDHMSRPEPEGAASQASRICLSPDDLAALRRVLDYAVGVPGNCPFEDIARLDALIGDER